MKFLGVKKRHPGSPLQKLNIFKYVKIVLIKNIGHKFVNGIII